MLNEQPTSPPSTESELTAVRSGHCPRCQGFLFLVRYEDWGWTTETQTALAWSCVQCGAILDAVIAANQRGSRKQNVSARGER